MLLDTSLRREMARNFGASCAVLFSVVLTLMLIRIVGQASDGSVDPRDMFVLIGLTSLSYLQFILELSLFIGVLLTFARVYRDSEMVIWMGAGAGPRQLFGSVLRFATPVLLVIAALTLVVWPWANQQTSQLRLRFEQRSDLSRVAPGRFRQSASGRRVFYIGNAGSGNGLARNIFIRDLADDGQQTVTVARSAELVNRDGSRYLMLQQGQRYNEATPTRGERITRFQSMGVRLSTLETPAALLSPAERLAQAPSREISTLAMVGTHNPNWLGELAWRLGTPISALLLALMALPLAASNPRAGRASQLLSALLIFLIYLNFLNAFQHWVELQRLHLSSSLLLLHGMAALLLLLLAWRKGMLSGSRPS